MKKGLVYILTNPSMPDWVKIGFTDNEDINQRLKELNSSTAVPLSFRVYATLAVENPREIEQHVHALFDLIDDSLHSIEETGHGKKRVREFFQVSPSKAYSVLERVASLNNNLQNLKRVVPSEEEQKEDDIAQTSRRSKMTFRNLKIPVGAELTYIYDETKKCVVKDDKRTVEYEGKETSLSALAQKLSNSKYKPQGTSYWEYQGETLLERRLRMEKEG